MKKIVYSILMIAVFSACEKEDTTPDPIPNPVPTDPIIPEEFAAFANIFDGEGVGAAIHLTEDIIVLFNQEGDKFAWFEDQEIKIVNDLDDSDSPFSECQFDKIGAGVKSNGSSLWVFDDDGEFYTRGLLDIEDVAGSWDDPDLFDWWDFSSPTNLWGTDNTIPINSVTAAWELSNPGDDCFDATETYEILWMVDGSGDELAIHSDQDGWSQDLLDIEDYTAENNCNGLDGLMPFPEISAAFRYVKPNMIQDVFFSEDGTQFCYYTVSEGVFSEIYDLY